MPLAFVKMQYLLMQNLYVDECGMVNHKKMQLNWFQYSKLDVMMQFKMTMTPLQNLLYRGVYKRYIIGSSWRISIIHNLIKIISKSNQGNVYKDIF